MYALHYLTKRNFILLGGAAVLIAGGIGYYFYSGSVSNPQQSAQEEIKDLVAQIGKLIVLPADEQPIVATVSDPEQLKGQAFFAKAQKGDKVLIYNSARKAILYSPTLKRVVDVAPLSAAAPTPAPR